MDTEAVARSCLPTASKMSTPGGITVLMWHSDDYVKYSRSYRRQGEGG